MSKLHELEEHIMACWNVTEDLDASVRMLVDTDASNDQVANVLMGMSELYSFRFNELFAKYEKLIAAKHKGEL